MRARTPFYDNAPVTVLIIGPSPDEIGGMSAVIQQTLDLDLSERYRTQLLPITLCGNPAEGFLRRCGRHIEQLIRLRAAINETASPLVHIHTCSGWSFYRSMVDLLVVQYLGSRGVLHIHGAKFDEFFESAPHWRRRIISWSLRRADRVVALSSGWKEKLRRMAPHAPVTVIENAVDIPRANTVLDANRDCRFLLLARMDEWKGIDDLLVACTLLRGRNSHFKLTLAGPPGTAGDMASLNRRIRNHGLESVVRYVGSVEGTQKSELLESSDVYVQPSHHEGMPIAVLEALAYGLPVIATNVGGLPEMLSGSAAGVLTPPRNPRQLAGVMFDIATDPVRRARMAEAAHELAVARFGAGRLRNDILRLYDGVLRGHRAGTRKSASRDEQVSTEVSVSAADVVLPRTKAATERRPECRPAP